MLRARQWHLLRHPPLLLSHLGEHGSGALEVESRRAEGVRVLFPGSKQPRRILGDVYAEADDDAEVGKLVQRPDGRNDRVMWKTYGTAHATW